MAKLIINDGIVGNKKRNVTSGGAPWLSFSVATKRWNGRENITDWIQCKLFGKRAESKLSNIIRKGSKVAVLGTMEINQYEGKTYVNCIVEDIVVHQVGKEDGESEQGENPEATNPQPDSQPVMSQEDINNDDDIPF